MSPRHNQAVTLIESIIVLVLLGLVILGFSSIDIFSRNQVNSADRQSKLQNDASYVLAHMTREIGKAIGRSTQSIVSTTNIASDPAIQVYVDLASDGLSAGNGKMGDEGDRTIAYRFTASTGSPAVRNEVWYYPNYANPADSHEVLSYKIASFTPGYTAGNNFVNIRVIACWDPANATSPYNGTPDNPCVQMQNQIVMPSVSTH